MGGWSDAIQSQIESQALGRASLRVVTATFSSAQLLAMFTNPIQILPAPGANKLFVIASSMSHYRFATTPYTITGMGQPKLFGTTWANGYWGMGPTALINQANEAYCEGAFISQNIPATALINVPMLFGVNGANPTLGDGTFTATIFYSVMDGSIQ